MARQLLQRRDAGRWSAVDVVHGNLWLDKLSDIRLGDRLPCLLGCCDTDVLELALRGETRLFAARANQMATQQNQKEAPFHRAATESPEPGVCQFYYPLTSSIIVTSHHENKSING